MSQENVENVRQGWETFNRHGVRAVAGAYWHTDVEMEVGPWGAALGVPARLTGREEAIAAIQEAESALGRLTAEVLDVAEGDDGVFAEVRLHATGTKSGAAVMQRFWYVVGLEDGRQRHIRIFDDRTQALEAAGLRE